jgi:hypothetical protein
MKIINWKISESSFDEIFLQQKNDPISTQILSFTLTNCENATNQEKDRQGKVALAIQFLWWDCFVLGNQNSCNLINEAFCEWNSRYTTITSCDSSGICDCSENKYNCRGELRQTGLNSRRCY